MRNESEEKRAERHRLVAEYEQSGKSIKAFCEERGISYWILQERIKKSKREERGEIELRFKEIPLLSSVEDQYVITLLSGRSLKVPAAFQEKSVEQLIGILERC